MTFSHNDKVDITTESDIVQVRTTVRETAINIGFGLTDVTRIVTAASELARNIYRFAGTGVMYLKTLDNGGRKGIELIFEDSGPGIDPQKLDGIFTAFFTTKPQGMGLGLAICRMIVEQHGGQLTASSDGKSGAQFQFVLPIKSETDAAAS